MTNSERQTLLLRHSITAERRRHNFITEYSSLTRDMLKCLLMYSQTGDDKHIEHFTKLLSYDFTKSWFAFIKQEGYEE